MHTVSAVWRISVIGKPKAGACTVDCDVSALSLGPAHPPVESIVTCLKGTGFDPHLDMDLLAEINDYFMKLREKYKEFASKRTGVDISVLKHQIPGGMLSNLESQLKGMNAENRINEVFEEVHKVHKDFGYPPLATPFAQMVGAQATINVLTGQRYKMISNESKTYIRGMYGRPAGEIAPELKAAVLGNDKNDHRTSGKPDRSWMGESKSRSSRLCKNRRRCYDIRSVS